MFDFKTTADSLIQKEVDTGEIYGANVMILHKGKEVYHNVFGDADRENGIRMKRDTIFRMYSMTKPITAVAVMLLAQRGDIDLLDPISKYLPCFADQKVREENGELSEPVRATTIWDLLNMSSGIPYPDEGHASGRQMGEIFRELIRRREQGERVDTMEYITNISQVPIMFQPGEKWMYGLSADILGGMIEAVTGKTFGQFLREELFEPLEMPDTGFYVPENKKHRFAQNYRWSEEEGRLLPFTKSHLGEYYREDVAFESGGAGLVSTIDDYSHFALMMQNKGIYKGKRILGSKTVEFMTQDRLTPSQRVDFNWDCFRGYGYGCLMRVLIDQGAAGSNAGLGEYGWDGWTGNYVTVDTKNELIILYFIQRCDTGFTPLVRKLRMITYGALDDL